MTISLYELATESFAPMLRSLADVLSKAQEQAKAKKIDPAKLAGGRLAPDMFPLTQQVQLACEHASHTFARLMGVEAPKSGDMPQTLDQMKARIAQTLDYLKSASEAKFAGAEKRKIEVPGPPGMKFEFTGLQLLRDWALPHFYFHAVTAYDILRHYGIEIGKRDYLSNVGKYIRQG